MVSPVTVFLIRHGSAGIRDGADPSDLRRPLDNVGEVQAQRLVSLLADTDIRRILSSPAPRCIETALPLAATLGLPVEPHDELVEGSHGDAAWELIEWAAHQEGDVVLCSHGDVIPDAVRRAQLRGMTVPGKAGCSKGSCWALNWDGERFDTGSYTTGKL